MLVVIANHGGQEVERRRRDARQGDLSGLALGQFANTQDRVFEIIEQAPRLGQEITADTGQANPTRGAFEQRRAQALFQLLDPPAECWLGKVQGLSCFMKAAEFGDFHERSDILQLIFHRFGSTS
ncbi:hypothetical protein D3C81_1891910 [compost metagenome]